MAPFTCGRRALLAGGASLSIAGLAGCSAIASVRSESAPELGRITVENADTVDHVLHVLLQRSGDPVHWSSHRLEAIQPPEDEDDHGEIDGAVLDDSAWAGETGQWTAYARVDDRSTWDRKAVPTDEADCYSLRLKIERDESVTIFLADCD